MKPRTNRDLLGLQVSCIVIINLTSSILEIFALSHRNIFLHFLLEAYLPFHSNFFISSWLLTAFQHDILPFRTTYCHFSFSQFVIHLPISLLACVFSTLTNLFHMCSMKYLEEIQIGVSSSISVVLLKESYWFSLAWSSCNWFMLYSEAANVSFSWPYENSC